MLDIELCEEMSIIHVCDLMAPYISLAVFVQENRNAWMSCRIYLVESTNMKQEHDNEDADQQTFFLCSD